MPQPDPVMERVGEAIGRGHAGDRDGARRILTGIWHELEPDGNPLQRCAVAHSMADVQDDPNDELAWDLRALEAARRVTDENTATAGMASGATAMYPSLHLNLADVYRRLGRLEEARNHVQAGLEHLSALGDNGYATMIKEGLERIARQLIVEAE